MSRAREMAKQWTDSVAAENSDVAVEAFLAGWKARGFEDAVRIEVLKEEVESWRLSHEHNESCASYRPMGDSYGWCGICCRDVGLNEDTARDTLTEVEKLLGDE